MFTARNVRGVLAAVLGAGVVASIGYMPAVRAADVSQDKIPASYAALMKMKPMDVMHMVDTEKKGYVTKEEFMKFHEAMFEKMDKDKNGQLSREEWEGRH
jgi:EF hand